MDTKKELKKKSIAKILMAYINTHRLREKKNDKSVALQMIELVRKTHPTSKLVLRKNVDYIQWYISRNRRQHKKDKPTDHLVVMPAKAKEQPKRKHGSKAKAKAKARPVKKTPASEAVAA